MKNVSDLSEECVRSVKNVIFQSGLFASTLECDMLYEHSYVISTLICYMKPHTLQLYATSTLTAASISKARGARAETRSPPPAVAAERGVAVCRVAWRVVRSIACSIACVAACRVACLVARSVASILIRWDR